ncbi:NAD(P)H-hydrate epimerase [Psychromicrobium lacuslunae]|uniref:Bifunctional NAD(P)H-hydrate repair enzyme n=1 Tax=Psychromicrobium lacuslunae TaxID=1618207 RepID=A0A0D4BZC6_9MICC|nr:NAD(P)H-hydrate epimerase [Psychromicrobium lacuslunae]AJT41673.1 sugar kinase [Psychromicrobium lacuslunae]
MITGYTGTAVRDAEQPLLEAGRGPELMAKAAYGLANAVAWRLRESGGTYGSSIVLLIGPGNNGGDALYAATLLLNRGVRATAVLVADRAHQEALTSFRLAGGRILKLDGRHEECLAVALSADLVIDGILGIGARGGLRGELAGFVERLAEHAPAVIACDLPSGLDADSGAVSGPLLAALETVTFGAIKTGLLLPPGEEFCGELSQIDLGLELGDAELRRLDEHDIVDHWPWPHRVDHKYSRGVLGVVAGSNAYPGAAHLALRGALSAGTGMIRYLGPADPPPEVVRGASTVAANRVQAWLVGPGVVEDEAQQRRCLDALRSGLPVVADAGALSLLPRELGPNIVLTPHAGELATLLSGLGDRTERTDVERQPLRHAKRAVELTGATVLLKGATTIVVGPDGQVYSQSEGTPWLATAGSGDTLAGIIGTLLASGVEPALAAAMAASVHGRAGVLASQGGPIAASDIATAVPRVLGELSCLA